MNYDEMLAAAAEAIEMPVVEEQAIQTQVDPGRPPLLFLVGFAVLALTGEVKRGLRGAFIWKESSQGDDFWRSQYNSAKLSPEGKAILEQWAEQAEILECK